MQSPGLPICLWNFAKALSQDRQKIKEALEIIHLRISEELEFDSNISDQIKSMTRSIMNYPLMELTMAERDSILAIGERLSSLLVHALLCKNGEKAILIDASEIIITDAHFGKALPNVEATRLQVIKKIPDEFIVVTQGFIGATRDGVTTTLGRGGSDLTAALLAEAISATGLFIYTDVRGVYTMDPNIISDAQPIKYMNFQEMAEIANFGAKILHPAAIEPCIRAKIPVVIASTFEPDKDRTYITPTHSSADVPQHVCAVTMRRKQTLITIRSLKVLNTYGFLSTVFATLAAHHVSVDLMTTSEVSVALTIDGTNIGSYAVSPITNQTLMNELSKISEIIIEEDLTLVALIGTALTAKGIIQQVLSKLIDPVRLVCYGASSSNIGLLMHDNDAVNAARILHQEFITKHKS